MIKFRNIFFFILDIINDEKLSPKDLINQYQLDKSRIAFTLCTKLPNGEYDVHPETTIISSIITELSTKQSTISNNKSGNILNIDLLEFGFFLSFRSNYNKYWEKS